MRVTQTAANKADDLRRAYLRAVEQIRARRDLTPDTKAQRIARRDREVRSQLADLERQNAADLTGSQRTARRSAFTIDDLPGDPAVLASSFRQAQAQARTVTSGRQAAQLYAQADADGDEVSMRALAAHAFEQSRSGLGQLDAGWPQIVNTYVADRPDKGEHIQHLVDVGQKPTINDQLAFYVPQPAELSRIPTSQLDAWADGPDAA